MDAAYFVFTSMFTSLCIYVHSPRLCLRHHIYMICVLICLRLCSCRFEFKLAVIFTYVFMCTYNSVHINTSMFSRTFLPRSHMLTTLFTAIRSLSCTCPFIFYASILTFVHLCVKLQIVLCKIGKSIKFKITIFCSL
jgi:hypothetical protein